MCPTRLTYCSVARAAYLVPILIAAVAAVGCSPEVAGKLDQTIIAATDGSPTSPPASNANGGSSAGSGSGGTTSFVPAFSQGNSGSSGQGVVAGAIVTNPQVADPLPNGDPTGGTPGGGGPGGTPGGDPIPVTGPHMELSTKSLDFGTTDSQASFTLQNVGGGALTYSIVSSVDWAFVVQPSGTNNGQVDVIQVLADRTWLNDWTITYVGHLTITSDNGQVEQIAMSIAVPPPHATVLVSHTLLDFGTESFRLNLTLTCPDVPMVPYLISVDDPWVKLSKSIGSIPGMQGETIALTVSRCEITWTAGVYMTTVRINALGADPIAIPVRCEVPSQIGDDALAALLAPLPELPKPHQWYSTHPRLLNSSSNALLYQAARISHTIAIPGPYATQTHVSNAVAICKAINATNPAIPCTLTVNYSPYHYFLPLGVPPWVTGEQVQQEWDAAVSRFTNIKNWLAAANQAQGTNVQISGILLNTEQWKAKVPGTPGADEWNSAATAKYDAMYNISKSVFPGIDVHWYNRGKPIERGGYFTLDEQGDSCSIECYNTYDLVQLKYKWFLGNQMAATINETHVIPWLTFNGGFYNGLGDGAWWYLCDLDYALAHSWQLGLELNYAGFVPDPAENPPLNAAQVIAIYPGIGDLRHSEFGPHLVAYVKGAANIPLAP